VIRNYKFFINSFPVLLSELTLVILLGFIGGGVFVTKQCGEITLGTQISIIHNYFLILNIFKFVFETFIFIVSPCIFVHLVLSPTYTLIHIIKILSQAITLVALFTPTYFDPYGSSSGNTDRNM